MVIRDAIEPSRARVSLRSSSTQLFFALLELELELDRAAISELELELDEYSSSNSSHSSSNSSSIFKNKKNSMAKM